MEVLIAFAPVVVMILMHFFHPLGHKITLFEMMIASLLCVVMAVGLINIARYSQASDVEVWNGKLTEKTKSVDYYSRPYDCDCTSTNYGTGKTRIRVRSCNTCYDTGHDMSWTVYTTIGNFTIDTQDCPHDFKPICVARYPDPEFWTNANIDDPVSKQSSYQNWVQAVDTSLMYRGTNFDAEDSVYEIDKDAMQYPIKVYDHYKIDRVLVDGLTPPNGQSLEAWNQQLANTLKIQDALAVEQRHNMIVVMTKVLNPSYAAQLIKLWEGANKNDIVIIAGFDESNVDAGPRWAVVHSWARSNLMNIEIRDSILDNPEWWQTPNRFFENVTKVVLDKFQRRSMEEFEYLKDEIALSTVASIMLLLLLTLLGALSSIILITVDPFNQDKR